MKIKLLPLFVPEIWTSDGTVISYKMNPIYEIPLYILLVILVLGYGSFYI